MCIASAVPTPMGVLWHLKGQHRTWYTLRIQKMLDDGGDGDGGDSDGDSDSSDVVMMMISFCE